MTAASLRHTPTLGSAGPDGGHRPPLQRLTVCVIAVKFCVTNAAPVVEQKLVVMPTSEAREPGTRTVPIHTWAVLVGGTAIAIGILWDISWHRTIGRDTF